MAFGAARLGALACAVAAIAVAGCAGGDEPRERAAAVSGSTLEGRWVDVDGDGRLERGPGEPLRDRTELGPARGTGRELVRFGQLTDPHVRDEESPARLATLDRFGVPFVGAFRPQEALSNQVLAAAVRSMNAFDPDAVVVSGDLIDNAQRNELDQALSVLSGGRVDPDTGRRGYEGPQEAANPDPLFYRPDVDAPRHPGLLRRAQRPFLSPGLDAPWFPVNGNHDLLVQGSFAPTERANELAVGSETLVRLNPDRLDRAAERTRGGGRTAPRGGRPPEELGSALVEGDVSAGGEAVSPEFVDEVLRGGLPGDTERISPDPERRFLEPDELFASLLEASGNGGERAGRLDYAFDLAPRVRGIVLDTVRRDQGSGGVVDAGQVAWLASELARAGDDWVVVFSHQPLDRSEGGDAALAVLDAHPRVAAAISGHLHRSSIEPRRSPGGGYWLITTASLADWPQQGRAFRLLETEGGGVALETWMLDHVGEEGLAPISRELAHLDAQGGRPGGSAGDREDRNVRLFRPGS